MVNVMISCPKDIIWNTFKGIVNSKGVFTFKMRVWDIIWERFWDIQEQGELFEEVKVQIEMTQEEVKRLTDMSYEEFSEEAHWLVKKHLYNNKTEITDLPKAA
jgi:reverse gyrase